MSKLQAKILKLRKKGLSCPEVAKRAKTTPANVRSTLFRLGATKKRATEGSSYLRIAEALEARARVIRRIAVKMAEALRGL